MSHERKQSLPIPIRASSPFLWDRKWTFLRLIHKDLTGHDRYLRSSKSDFTLHKSCSHANSAHCNKNLVEQNVLQPFTQTPWVGSAGSQTSRKPDTKMDRWISQHKQFWAYLNPCNCREGLGHPWHRHTLASTRWPRKSPLDAFTLCIGHAVQCKWSDKDWETISPRWRTSRRSRLSRGQSKCEREWGQSVYGIAGKVITAVCG